MNSSEDREASNDVDIEADTQASDTHKQELREELLLIAHSTGDQQQVEEEDRTKVFEGVSRPESRRYEPTENYRFLVHTALNGQQGASHRFLQLAADTDGFRRDKHDPKQRPLNTSIIDADHSWTFEGLSGFLIEPPEDSEDIIGAYPTDAAVNDWQAEPKVPSANELLEATSQTGYNQINIAAGRAVGVFIRVQPDGTELGDNAQNTELRRLATEAGLPVAELVVKPREMHLQPAELTEQSAAEGSQLWHMTFPEEGHLLKVEVVHLPETREQSQGMQAGTFEARIRDIDPYGQTDGDLKAPEKLARLQDRLKAELPQLSAIQNGEILQAIERCIANATGQPAAAQAENASTINQTT